MSLGRRVRAATAVAAAFVVWWACVSVCPARAGDDDDPLNIVFSGRDIWRNGVFAYGGFLFAPGGFEQDGFLLKVLISAGAYRYKAESLDGATVIGAEWLTQVLPGWRIKRGPVEAKFFFGPDFQTHRLWPADTSNRLSGGSIGLRVALELWVEPTPATMLTFEGSLSTIATSNDARIAFGWRIFEELLLDGFYLGPEAQYFGADGYRHLRLGAHITSMKTGETEWSASIGVAHDSDGRGSPYLRLGLMQRR
jgi:hypothetical protein